MVFDALRGYVELASGLTEVNRQRAVAEAKALLAAGSGIEQLLSEQAKGLADDVGRQVQSLADDLIATSKANRQVLVALVRAESERAVGSLGLATADEISSLRRKVERLERRLAQDESGSTASTRTAKKSAAKKSPAKRAASPKPAGPAASKPADPATPKDEQ